MDNPANLFPELDEDLRSFNAAGILPCQEIERLIRNGHVRAEGIGDDQIQPASMDLRLGSVAYRVRASFLPGKRHTVASKLGTLAMHTIDLTQPAVLEKGCVYIVPLMEELSLPHDTFCKANPKSTTGRLDIFTRLLTDYGHEFERVLPGYKGKLYAEIVPRTFTVLVHQGTKLNQLRFLRGQEGRGIPSDAKLGKLDRQERLVYGSDDQPGTADIDGGLWISIDLGAIESSEVVGYRAKKHTPEIDLDKIDYYDPREFWETIIAPQSRTIILDPDDFYILVSKQRVRVPPHYAAEMVAYDPSVGEFRIHYAGFFDPGFGYGKDDIKGTRAVLEVRTHEVPFLLEDEQIVGRLVYEQLLEPPTKVYGARIGSSYQSQGVWLSKQFKRP